ncbi:immunoglobulin domain-containing protein, partial [Bacteroidota bacterium]
MKRILQKIKILLLSNLKVIARLFLSLTLVSLFLTNAYSTNFTVGVDTINTNTTWTGVDTVILDTNLVIDSTAKLTIDSGIVVHIQGWYQITVHGIISAVGTPIDSIVFTRGVADTAGYYDDDETLGAWRGIILDNQTNTTDSFDFKYCKVEFIKHEAAVPHTIRYLNGYKLNVKNSFLKDNRGGIQIFGGDNVYIDSCKFINNNMYYNCNSCRDIAIMDSATNINITNNTFTTASNAIISAGTYSSNINIYNNSLTAISRYNSSSGPLDFIVIHTCEAPIVIRKNTLIKKGGYGAGINITASEVLIDSNYIKVYSYAAIELNNESSGLISNNVVDTCTDGINGQTCVFSLSGNLFKNAGRAAFFHGFAEVTFNNDTFINNTKGIELTQCDAEINNSFICNNTTYGIILNKSNVSITNCLIANNESPGTASAVYASQSTCNIINSTIANNLDLNNVYAPVTYASSDGDIFNTIFYKNSINGDDEYQICFTEDIQPNIINCGYEAPTFFTKTTESATGLTGTYLNNVVEDPLFIKPTVDSGKVPNPLADTINWRIDITSPYLNAGLTSANSSEKDLSDGPRILNGQVDIGAYESYIQKDTAEAFTSDQIWIADTIYVTSNLTIGSDYTLTISPGVTVLFTGWYKINCSGTIKAIGSDDYYITFTIDDTTGFHSDTTWDGSWNGIEFIDDPSETDTTEFSFCKFQYFKNMAFELDSRRKFIIENCIFEYANFRVNADFAQIINSVVQIKNNTFRYLDVTRHLLFTYNGTIADIENNVFYENDLQDVFYGGEVEINIINNKIYSNPNLYDIFQLSDSKGMAINNLVINNNLDRLANISSNSWNFYFANNTCTYNTHSSDYIEIGSSIFENNIITNNNNSTLRIRGGVTYPAICRNNYVSSFAEFVNTSYPDCILDDNPNFVLPIETAGYAENADTADYRLYNVSQAINNGYSDASNLPTTDLGGSNRINDNVVDIGAYENQGGLPEFITQPTGKLVCEGVSNTFSITTSNLAYVQWFKDGDSIIGETNETLLLTNISISDAGTYTCKLSNGYGTVESNNAVLNVKAKPKILSNPEHRFITDESQVSIEVAVTGTEPVNYQWYADDVSIPGFTTATLEYAEFDTTLEGDYKMVATNACGEDSTDIFGMYVVPSISIENSDSICLGENIQINARAGYPAFYLWFKNGTFLGGDTLNPYLNLNSIEASDEGNYSCLITTPTYGNIFTEALFISVNEPVEIVSQPSSDFIDENDDIELSTIVSGTTPIAYEWICNDTIIPGKTKSTLNLESFAAANEGYYKTRVNNICGMDSTQNSRLYLTPKILIVDNDSVFCKGEEFGLFTQTNLPDRSFQWYKNGNVMSGEIYDTLYIPALTSLSEGSYYCEVSDTNGNILTDPLYISVGEAPIITTEPASTWIDSLTSFTVTVGANGSGLEYQWYQNDALMPGENSNQLKFAGFRPETDEGAFKCKVENGCGVDSTTDAYFYVTPGISIETEDESTTLCLSDSLRLAATITTYYSAYYQWYKNGTAISGENDSLLFIASVQANDAGSYTCLLIDSIANGEVETDPVYISIYQAPEIVSQPSSAFINEGAGTTSTVVASGTSPFTYNWTLDESPVGGNTSALNISSFGATNEGIYEAKVENSCGIDSTDEFSLYLVPKVHIKDNDTVFCENTRAVIFTETNMPSPNYQWYKNGNIMTGKTSDSLIFESVTLNNEGNYYCLVSSSVGSAETDIAYAIVSSAPEILSEPDSKWIDSLTSFTVSVGASGSDLSYQWYKDDVLILGETSNKLKFAGFQPITDEGVYNCIIENDCGIDTTTNAAFYIKPSIAIETETGLPTLCTNDSLRLVVSPSYTATYQWRKNGVTLTGETDSVLRIISVDAGNAGSYSCYVSSIYGNIEANPIYISVSDVPQIISQPSDAFVNEGNEIEPALIVSGTAPITYSWLLNSVPIPGEINSSLNIASFAAGNEGVYKGTASNLCGSDTTNEFAMYISPPILVKGNDSIFCEGENVVIYTVTNLPSPTFQWYKNGNAIAGETDDSLKFTPISRGEDGNYSCYISSAISSTSTDDLFVTISETPNILSEPDSKWVDSLVSFTVSVGASGNDLTYQWYQDDISMPGETSNQLKFAGFRPIIDEGVFNCIVENGCGVDTATDAAFFVKPSINIETDAGLPTLCSADSLRLVVSPSYTATYQWRKNGVALSGETDSVLRIVSVDAGNAGSYSCYVTGTYGNIEANPIYISVSDIPQIISQPTDAFITEGNEIEPAMIVSGTAPIVYSWIFNSSVLPGETGSSLNIAAFAAGDEGIYKAKATNLCGVDSTDEFSMYLTPPILVKDNDTVFCEGERTVIYTETNLPSPTYKWYRNGNLISGATTDSLIITSVSSNSEGNYHCLISSSAGSVQTSTLYISVYQAPDIMSQPPSVFITEGNEISTNLIAIGTTPLEYTWLLDGTEIPGETNSSLVIASFAASDEGIYKAKATNICGEDSTDEFTMYIAPPILVKGNDTVFCEGEPTVLYTETNLPSPTYKWYKNGNLMSGQTSDSLKFAAISRGDEGNYYCTVSSTNGSESTPILFVSISELPSIVNEPDQKWVDSLSSFTVDVGASGTGPMTYQWFQDGVELLGETANQIQFAGFRPILDEGIFTCVVQNGCGTDTSGDAPFFIKPSIAIESGTGVPTLCKNDSLKLVVSPNYTATYQWRKNGVEVTGETDSIIYIASVEAGDAGSYTCNVSGDFGNIETNPIFISISEVPDIVTQPASAFVQEGNEVKPALFVSGTAPIVYMWYYNGTIIPGANSSSLTISSFTS